MSHKLIVDVTKKLFLTVRTFHCAVNYIKSGKNCSDEVGKRIDAALGVDVTEILED